ncbi:MAG: hypothetical protein J0H73_03885, partial [Salana multivorans]|nr:hypothetical protein [Salana multivorans]
GTGAHGLRAILEEVLMDVMFDVPGRDDVERVVVTKECVTEGNGATLVLRAPSGSARRPRAQGASSREKTPA